MNMRSLFSVAVLLGLCLPAPLGAREEVFELTFQNLHAPAHIYQSVYRAWAEEVREKSNGRLILHHVDNASLTTRTGAYQGLKDGTVDITFYQPNYTTTELPRAASLYMPFLVNSAANGVDFFFRAYEAFPELRAELNGNSVFLAIASSGGECFMTTTPNQIFKPEDVRGKRVVVWSTEFPAAVVQACGGHPMYLSVTDTYVGLQRGMGDVAFINMPSLRPLKLQELGKTITRAYWTNSYVILGVNQEVWDMLPEDLQQILKDTSGYALSARLAQTIDDGELTDLRLCEDEGIIVHQMTDEEFGRMRQVLTDPASKTMEWWRITLEKANMPDREEWIQKIYALANEIRS